MFTCGLLRSNFSFAIACSAPPLELDENPPASLVEPAPPNLLPGNPPGHLADHFLGNRTRRLGVMREMHREGRASLCPAAKIRSVAKHFRQRNFDADHIAAGAILGALNRGT